MKEAFHVEETDIEKLFIRLNSENSELQKTRLLYAAYRLHKGEGKKPKRRQKIPKSGKKKKAFAITAAERTGLSKSTIYNRLDDGDVLQNLSEGAIQVCLGTALSNHLSVLVRIARLPKQELHIDIVNQYDRNRKEALEELAKWEATLLPPNVEENDDSGDEQDGSREEGEDENDDVVLPDDEEAPPQYEPEGFGQAVDPAVLTVLGIESVDELLPAVQRLVAEKVEAQRRCAALESELNLYRSGQIGQVFDLLGAKTARGALDVIRDLKEAANA